MIKKFFQNRVVLNSIILFIFTFTMEMVVRVLTQAHTDISLLRIIVSSWIVSIIVAFIGHFLPKLGQRILNIVYCLAAGIYMFGEFGLYNFLGFFMGIGNANQGTKVTSYILDFIKSLKPVHWTLLIPIVLILIYYIFFDKKVFKNKKRNKELNTIKKVYIEIVTLTIILLLCLGYSLLVKSEKFQNELQTESNTSLWKYPENSNLAVNNFGVLMYGFADLKAAILKTDTTQTITYKKKDNNKKEEVVVDLLRKIDDTSWNKVIENTTDNNYKTLNDYFINRSITPKNEMTGIFKDKNLIIILMESVNDISILSEEYFPTLYKMYNEGISFRNNFSPRNCCSTGNNELTVLSSLFTINSTCTANAYADNKYFEGAFNIFNNAGYYTSGYHDYTDHYYKRSKILPNLGANKFYGVTDLGMTYNPKYEEWPSDVDFMKATQDHYMNEEKFMTYLAAVSTHQTYHVPSVLGDMYMNDFRSRGFSTTLSRYLSKMKVLDQALEELLNELSAKGKLDDTVIALFGDHFAYGLSDGQINEFLSASDASYRVNRNSITDKNVDRTPLIIYNSKTEAKVVNDYTTIIDLLPTLLNMFDMDYDPRLYLGTDIFSPEHVSRAVFADGSWQDERGYYHAPNSKMNYIEGAINYTTEEIKEINSEISVRQKMSGIAIRSNYFNYLGNELNKYKVLEENKINEETKVEE